MRAIVPGALVRHPDEPDWGLGQVRSVIGQCITANFEGTGKVSSTTDHVDLIVVEDQAVAW
jgi:hypothetical protein